MNAFETTDLFLFEDETLACGYCGSDFITESATLPRCPECGTLATEAWLVPANGDVFDDAYEDYFGDGLRLVGPEWLEVMA